MILLRLRLSCCVVFLISVLDFVQNAKEGQSYWKEVNKLELEAALKKEIINKHAKNVILFVGDGMGPTTVTASRIFSKTEKGKFAFENFTNVGVLKTYSANKLVPDSCSTATALFSGVKANHKTSGLDATVDIDDCDGSLNKSAHVHSFVSWAQAVGKSTGFVTTTRITHATPSALYAHTPNRKWECEDTMPSHFQSKCKDIARQLIEDLPGKNINVIMGGGRQVLQSNTSSSEDDPLDTWSCISKANGRNLIHDWIKDKQKRQKNYAFVTNNEELDNVDLSAEFILGVFANGHLKMEHARNRGPSGMPSLANMTYKAIKALQRNHNGFVLMVEGGLIDMAHHRGHAKQALSETNAFNEAIEVALNLTHKNDTLIIVTADHAHSIVFTGYPDRGDDIIVDLQKSKMDSENYTPLIYGIGGPDNYKYYVDDKGAVKRLDPALEDRSSYNYSQIAAVLADEVYHSGSDVLIYANGPMAHLFTSVHEQTYVAQVIAYAAKIGPFAPSGSTKEYFNLYLTVLVVIIVTII